MNVSQFVAKWRKSKLSERAASQEHFIDLCRVFDHPTPAEVDGVGDQFTFERALAKASGRPGRADVWKRGFFAWEYKSPGKDLGDAYAQLLQYREALLNPPLLVACDMGKLEIRTNFTRRATKNYPVNLHDLGNTEYRRIVEDLFWEPDKLEPGLDVQAITDKAAGGLAQIARRMRGRGLDPSEVARFLDRVVFCMFAQDVRLLKDHDFTKLIEKTHRDPRRVSQAIFQLFEAMSTGGEFALEEIPHFNGDLFKDIRPIELTGFEVDAIYKVTSLNWGAVDASILGTLFERGMDPTKEAELGTHYTKREDISAIVDPVVMEPLRREWAAVRDETDLLIAKTPRPAPTKMRAKSPKQDPAGLRKARGKIADFLQRLQDVTILDPACGSGNFLFVSLQKLKDLEKEVIVYANERNIDGFFPAVSPLQLRGIEKSPYAYDLARTSIWIGWLQWTKANGYKVDWKPILQTLGDNLRNADAILDLTDPENPKEPEWPAAEFIVGNPPFLGDKKMRRELGDDYVESLRRLYGDRIPGQSDLCCYWFEKARSGLESSDVSRVGLLSTQSIRGGASRKVLERIKQTGDIFFAASDRDWIQDGANVHVSMVGFDAGVEATKILDGKSVRSITPSLTADLEHHRAAILHDNRGVSFIGPSPHARFDIPEEVAIAMVSNCPNPTGFSNSDVIRPVCSAVDLVNKPRNLWTIDFGCMPFESAILYESPFEYVTEHVKPHRLNKRGQTNPNWWQYERPRPELREKVDSSPKYIATPRVSKYRVFAHLPSFVLCNDGMTVFALTSDFSLGVLHSRLHEVWARLQGTQLRERESGFRYTPTTCFETFPLPEPFAGLRAAIGEAAKELEAVRSRWLNPPEWTREEVLEFPGSANGPWGRHIQDADASGIGTVRYVRRVPKDAECAARLAKRTLTALYNQRPAWLGMAHRKLDEAVFAAYGWKPDLTDDEILSRLLALNLERAAKGAPAVPVDAVAVPSL